MHNARAPRAGRGAESPRVECGEDGLDLHALRPPTASSSLSVWAALVLSVRHQIVEVGLPGRDPPHSVYLSLGLGGAGSISAAPGRGRAGHLARTHKPGSLKLGLFRGHFGPQVLVKAPLPPTRPTEGRGGGRLAACTRALCTVTGGREAATGRPIPPRVHASLPTL